MAEWYQVIKRYGHDQGWSCTFRQWRADHSHCRFVHGYPLAFEFVFGCYRLDDKNWVIDFGGLKPLKDWLQDTFDHKMLVAEDDPALDAFIAMQQAGIADIKFVPHVGCEKFAELAFQHAEQILRGIRGDRKVHLESVMVSEHFGNSAIYKP
jgi:6-pyruvoyltetrahydropterin/6-carboxytetrahydropterin synthase